MAALLAADVRPYERTEQLPLSAVHEPVRVYDASVESGARDGASETESPTPADALFSSVRTLMAGLIEPLSVPEIAADLDVYRPQTEAWLTRLVEEGALERLTRPVRYCRTGIAGPQTSTPGGSASPRTGIEQPPPDGVHETGENSKVESPAVASWKQRGGQTASEVLLAIVRSLVKDVTAPRGATDIAATLDVSPSQATKWLNRLVEEGVAEKLTKPVRYRRPTDPRAQTSLFD